MTMTGFQRASALACSTTLVWLAACGGGDDGGGGVGPPEPPEPPVLASVSLASEDSEPQVGASVAVTAHARDASGSPMSGVRIDFAAGASSGTVSPAFGLTNADGAVSATWTVATVSGLQSLAARSGQLADTLVITVVPGPPASAAAEEETDFETDPGASLPVAIVVRDRWDNLVPGVPVVFDVLTGGGTAHPDLVQTDAEGRAASTWTLGPDVGLHSLGVTAGELEALVFTAIAGDVLWIQSAVQERWPESDEITLRGRRMELITGANVLVNGGPPSNIAVISSTQAVVRPRPLSGAASTGCAPERAAQLSVVAPGVGFSAPARLLHGPFVALDVGQELRLSGNDHCLRLLGERNRSEQYVLAAVEQSYIDAAQSVSEEWHYRGGTPFKLVVADSTAQGPPATSALAVRIQPPSPDPFALHHDHVRLHVNTAAQQGESVWRRTDPYKVGDEFYWYTGDDREGTFQVMALYDPNFVLAVFKEDMSALWDDRRAASMDTLFQNLGSQRVQDLYRTNFGGPRPQTSPGHGQMLFMFHDGSDAASTGVAYSAPNFRESTIHFRRLANWDVTTWYFNLVAHELGHTWQYSSIGRLTAVWSGEGIANWIAQERFRTMAGLDLDANHPLDRRILGWRLRLPETGDFVAGYRESAPFLQFLVTRLVLDHGQPYASSARRVVTGAAEGWWGHHFVNWDVAGYGGGLVSRMREVVPDWDPVEARLDWMVSIALDDRANLSGYSIPFVRGVSQSLRPVAAFDLGQGASLSESLPGGGNYYFVIRTPGETGALHLVAPEEPTAEGVPTMAWKLVRWR